MSIKSKSVVYGVIVVSPEISKTIADKSGFTYLVASNHFANLLNYHTDIDGPSFTMLDTNFDGNWSGLHSAVEAARPDEPILVFVHHDQPLSSPIEWLRLMSVTGGKCFSFDKAVAMHSRDGCAISAIGIADKF